MDQILHLIKKEVYTSLDETNMHYIFEQCLLLVGSFSWGVYILLFYTSDQKYTAQNTGEYTFNFLDKGIDLGVICDFVS
jgi:hypothetical protein